MPIDTSVDGQSECGSMRISDSELRYVGGDHWVAILDGIADLKDHLDREEQLRLAQSSDLVEDEHEVGHSSGQFARARSNGAFLLYGCRRATSRHEILSALPPKSAVDRYISRYFNYLDLVSSSAVHGPSFLREIQYEAFWADPSDVSIIWVGLLFGMICLACLASDPPDGPDAEQQSLQINLYREKIVQCLVMGEYTKCGPYALETLINYVYVEFCIRADAAKDIWFLLALEVNLARRMGYHRDPGHFSGISPFRGEMRRRLWATVLMSDILISNQMGMPRMISDWQYDTAEPRNLNDADFDEDTVELPQPRPETEHTTALGIIARRRMLKALGIIADLTSAVQPCSYGEVMRVDSLLHEAAASIPPPLQMKPMAASVTDSPQVILARLFIRHMFYKGQITLHRRFLYMRSPSQNEDVFDYSRKACLDASLESLAIQHVLDEETCPGGQLHTMRWRVTSIMNHQFLTATMILCSLLYHEQTLQREDEIRGALQRARTVWMRRPSTSKEAKKAAETINIVLSKTGKSREGDGRLKEDASGEAGEQSAQRSPPIMQDALFGITFGGEKGVTDSIGFYEPDPFIMPELLGTFLPLDLQGQDLSFDVNNPRLFSDELMPTNWPGS
ncbi:uncharacterized transcriptional regulatory protein C1F7.11c [Aspergillus udagawae]|uniref:Uncharacterized transcriptional regulatory protein C1F7.11c n=1 Tax=Aspergillus udagawae TaxID=91492 RepID=A0ABQ1AKL9_9EURO|nr:uncharacterized transcriptional regulatory protein C1F7.11c [Aspergillus udagawae]